MELFKLFGTIAVKNAEANKAIDDTVSKAKNSRKNIDGSLTGAEITVDNSKAVKEMSETESKADKTGKELDDKLDAEVEIDVQSAKENLDDVADKTENTESRMSGALKKIGSAVAAAFAVDKIKDFGTACVESAAAVKAENSQFEQTFGDMQKQAEEAIGGVADSSGILDTRLQSVGTSIYAFAKTTGMESTEALDLMERSLMVTADSAAYYDRSLEDTAESLKSFLKGNYENDSALGLSCTETTRNAAANELYGKSFKELSESQKQLTLLQMVEDANELSGAMGQAARESDGYENVMGNLNESWRQFKAEIGEPVLEKVVPMIQKVTSGLSSMKDKISQVQQWLEKHKTTVKVVTTVLAALTAGVIAYRSAMAISTLISTVTAALNGMSVAQYALNLAMSLNPVGLVVAAIASLIAIFVILWNKCDGFREFWIGLWESIQETLYAFFEAWEIGWNGVVDFFTVTIPDKFREVKEFFGGLWSEITETTQEYIDDWVEGFNTIVEFFTVKIPGAITKFKDNWISGFNSIKNDIKTWWYDVKCWFVDGINSIIDKINSFGFDMPDVLGGEHIGFSIPHVSAPEMEEGGVLPKGKKGYLEGNGDEAVVPLEKNTGWTSRVADYISEDLYKRKELYPQQDRYPAESGSHEISSKLDRIITLLETFFPKLLDKFDIVIEIDGDRLVAKLMPKLDKAMGEKVKLSERGLA